MLSDCVSVWIRSSQSRAIDFPAAVAAARARALPGSRSSARVASSQARPLSPLASFSSLRWASLDGPAQPRTINRASEADDIRRNMRVPLSLALLIVLGCAGPSKLAQRSEEKLA